MHTCRCERGHYLHPEALGTQGPSLGLLVEPSQLPLLERTFTHCLLPTAAPFSRSPRLGSQSSASTGPRPPLWREALENSEGGGHYQDPLASKQGPAGWDRSEKTKNCSVGVWRAKCLDGQARIPQHGCGSYGTVPNSTRPPVTGKPSPREGYDRATRVALMARAGTRDTGMLAGIY